MRHCCFLEVLDLGNAIAACSQYKYFFIYIITEILLLSIVKSRNRLKSEPIKGTGMTQEWT